jgi:hypothetical protein
VDFVFDGEGVASLAVIFDVGHNSLIIVVGWERIFQNASVLL